MRGGGANGQTTIPAAHQIHRQKWGKQVTQKRLTMETKIGSGEKKSI